MNRKIKISINDIRINNYNPNELSTQKFHDLKTDIKDNGLHCPILVRRIDAEHFEIIDGENRFKAANDLGWMTIDCEVYDISREEAMAMNYKTNSNRGNINYIKLATMFQELVDEGRSQLEIGRRFSITQQRVSQYLALLTYPPFLQEMIDKRRLTLEHARKIMQLNEDDVRHEATTTVIDKNLSVRQTQELVKNLHHSDVWGDKEHQNYKAESSSDQESLKEKYDRSKKEFTKSFRDRECSAKLDPEKIYDLACETIPRIKGGKHKDLWWRFTTLFPADARQILIEIAHQKGRYFNIDARAECMNEKTIEFYDYLLELVESAINLGIEQRRGEYLQPGTAEVRCPQCNCQFEYYVKNGIPILWCSTCKNEPIFNCMICYEKIFFNVDFNGLLCVKCGFKSIFTNRIFQVLTRDYVGRAIVYDTVHFAHEDERLKRLAIVLETPTETHIYRYRQPPQVIYYNWNIGYMYQNTRVIYGIIKEERL